ncbi:hypothetical protein AVEN_241884-1 [Araneus ventricosus]|uniref:Uncharacterized protein n=1 Tax=Araneus ventricosus TaxID=182803 RepID=A0A4Y2ALY0_ARAVE|nr:hypothetical protein AVEN_241883-1 [Araneus ventricosus]GBL80647.1 hypothetical protein AVEN_241884-1 [Araneus ventricosus]
MRRSIENKTRRDRKKYKRRLYDSKICTEKEQYTVKRDCERLEIETVSSNSLPYNQKLRVDKLYPKKKTITLNTSQNKTWHYTCALQKSIFRRFHNSGTAFSGHATSNMIFWDK